MRIPALRTWSLNAHIAGILLLVALLFDAILVMRVRHLGDGGSAAPVALRAIPRIVISTPNQMELMRQAARAMPFGADNATNLPATSNTVVQQSQALAPPRPRLVGTVMDGRGGGFVVLELVDGRMQIVRTGERAGDLRLRSVSAGEAVFDDLHGGRVSLRTPTTGSGSESRP